MFLELFERFFLCGFLEFLFCVWIRGRFGFLYRDRRPWSCGVLRREGSELKENKGLLSSVRQNCIEDRFLYLGVVYAVE